MARPNQAVLLQYFQEMIAEFTDRGILGTMPPQNKTPIRVSTLSWAALGRMRCRRHCYLALSGAALQSYLSPHPLLLQLFHTLAVEQQISSGSVRGASWWLNLTGRQLVRVRSIQEKS